MASYYDNEEEDYGLDREDELEDDDLEEADEEELEDEDEEGEFLEDDEDEEYDGDAADFGDLESVIESGEELLDANEHARAIDLFTHAVDQYPDEPDAHYYLGLSYYSALREDIEKNALWEDDADMVETYESAVSSFDNTIALDAEHTGALNCLGALYCLRENYEAAISCWGKSLQIDPDQEEVEADLEDARGMMEGEG